MHRPFLIGLLAFGTVAGYASGFHALRYGGCHHGGCSRWSEYERESALQAPAPAPAPVVVNAAPTAPAAQPQTLVIPIVINPGVQAPAAPAAQPAAYVVQVPAQPALPVSAATPSGAPAVK